MATTASVRPDRSPGWRRVATVALGAGLAWLSFAVSVDNVIGARAPAIAARWGAGGAITDAARATVLAQPDATPAALADVERLANRALAREPVSVAALRALAVAAALRPDLPRADRLFGYAERLSRRDLATQMWLIEQRVRDADVAGALIHYDRALRTAQRARPTLFPVLISATATPEVARGLERLLARRSAWGPDFLAVMAEAPDASPDVLGRLLVAADLRLGVAGEREALEAVLRRLVVSGRYAPAYLAWRRAVGEWGPAPLVHDGGFETDPVLAPFDWTFTDATDLSATREPQGAGTALVLRAPNGGAGEFARQLLLLRPGAYRLTTVSAGAGADPVARAAIVLGCASGGGELLRLPLSATARTRLGGGFSVPDGCGAQTLTIVAAAGLGGTDAAVTVDDLAIVPTAR